MSNYRSLVLCLVIVLGPLFLVGCSDDDQGEGKVITTEEQASYCLNIEQTRDSLAKVNAAMNPPDVAAMQNARQDISASIEYLYNASLNLQGGTDLVANLRADLNEFNSLLATQDLVGAKPELQAQAQAIENDLDQMEAAGNCP